ncbi:translation initiation factor [Arachidicoccus ginsenosidivorans]|uniref:Translation initiation factor n=1 Tax=Arachidicoccus ginsenosidivorans TaxID=496057 RepID=A0A5B8VSA7_9BACT|nr:translation initiation factor [Arachidicoccus ginsenosidivorans]QEC73178.1 translation initiation factor [Arachidicoccus ginsenosidivorans]
MAKNKKVIPGSGGYVYSTDPDFKIQSSEEKIDTPSAAQQKLRIWLETKNRGGKAATVIKGFSGSEDDLKELGKKLKTFTGTGGSVKDQEIIIQGDQREKVLGWLLKAGYSGTKIAGK